jgi:predicted nucleotidyltransferase
MSKLLVGFAMDYASFLLQNLSGRESNKIKAIILFGSAAREEATPQSDVDIFIDVTEGAGLKKRVDDLTEDFYKGELYKRYWRLLGIENPVAPIVDRLENWPDLKSSIIADGLVIYGKYVAPAKGEAALLIWWTAVKPQSKRIALSKKLYGWSYRKEKHEGLVARTGTIKLGPNTLLIPLESAKAITEAFKGLGIDFRSRHVSQIK